MIFSLFLFSLLFILPVFSDTSGELGIETVHLPENCDEFSENKDKLSVHYTGSIQSTGIVFDSSLNRGVPFKLNLGSNQVIKGWELGLLNMCVGETRILTIPPHLGYGQRGFASIIPGGSTLIFEVELMKLEKAQ